MEETLKLILEEFQNINSKRNTLSNLLSDLKDTLIHTNHSIVELNKQIEAASKQPK